MAHEVGRFFRELREAFHLSPAQIAARLSTRVDIVMALETGLVRELPPWPETCRIVRTYTSFAGLDPRPALQSLEMLMAAEVSAPQQQPQRQMLPQLARREAPKFMPREPTRPEPLEEDLESDGLRGLLARHTQAARLLFAAAIPVALIVLITQTSVLEAAVAKLPPSMVRIVRGAQNYVIVQMAPVRDGLRWIDVPDPRSRRGDKLQTASQSD
jgi:hypothetical protein